jgi:hypothetical protein
MFTTTLDISDVLRKLDALGSDAELARTIAQKVADEAVIPELAKEPYRSTRKKMIFKSAKQRAFVMAAIKDGRIEVPYRRTGKIGMSEKHPTSNGMDVVVPVGYSDLVRTKGKQADYHNPLWPTTDQIAQKLEADVVEVIGTAAVLEALQKAGLA